MKTAAEVPIPARKQQALERFLETLLNSEVRDAVGEVVLFGSVAEGQARPNSDIDVLIFGTDKLSELSSAVADVAFDVAVETGESIEPLIYSVETLRHPHYFVAQAIRHGKELYKMDQEALHLAEAEAALRLAKEYLVSAEHVANDGFYRVAMDAAQFSAELCARALVILAGAEPPTTHGGVAQMFGKLYVQSGKVGRELGRQLNAQLAWRNRARYDVQARVTAEDANEGLAVARNFIDLLERELATREDST